MPGGVWGVLTVVGGNDRGKQFQLTNQETSIGRGADQDLVLADIAVSRRHFVIVVDGERYRLKDLGSGNGTLINGVRLDTVLLNDGDQIECGNTVMRLEHPPSRAGVLQAPVPQASPENKTMMADAGGFQVPGMAPPAPVAQPSYQQPYGQPMQQPMMQPMGMQPQMGMQGMQGMQPMGGMGQPGMPIASPNPMRPMDSGLPQPINTGNHGPVARGGLLDTTAKKIAVIGAALVILGLGGALVAKKMGVFGGGGDAQKLYADGAKAFQQGDYPTAKTMLSSAIEADPEMAEARKLLKQCDIEIHARTQLAHANGLYAQNKFDEVLKALDSIDKHSKVAADAEDLRGQTIPKAVDGYIETAKQAVKDNKPEDAQAALDEVAMLQPDNGDAAEIEKQLKAVAPQVVPVEKGGTRVKPAHTSHSSSTAHASETSPNRAAAGTVAILSDDDDENVGPSKAGKGAKPATPTASIGATPAADGPVDILSSKAGGPYRARDFSTAATALRGIKGAESLSMQVSQLGGLYFKAEQDKTKNPSAALTEYQQAMALDQKIGKGTHTPYFKSQMSALYTKAAQSAFAAGKYDEAAAAVKQAQRAGASDGGVGQQLSSKAASMIAQAAGLQKSNINGAKSLWRTVLRMVPPDDPSFGKATAGLKASENKATAAPTDEDE